jgi:hypothetical protein
MIPSKTPKTANAAGGKADLLIKIPCVNLDPIPILLGRFRNAKTLHTSGVGALLAVLEGIPGNVFRSVHA